MQAQQSELNTAAFCKFYEGMLASVQRAPPLPPDHRFRLPAKTIRTHRALDEFQRSQVNFSPPFLLGLAALLSCCCNVTLWLYTPTPGMAPRPTSSISDSCFASMRASSPSPSPRRALCHRFLPPSSSSHSGSKGGGKTNGGIG